MLRLISRYHRYLVRRAEASDWGAAPLEMREVTQIWLVPALGLILLSAVLGMDLRVSVWLILPVAALSCAGFLYAFAVFFFHVARANFRRRKTQRR